MRNSGLVGIAVILFVSPFAAFFFRGLAVGQPLRDCEGVARQFYECLPHGLGVWARSGIGIAGEHWEGDRTFQKRVEEEQVETDDSGWLDWGNPRNERQEEEAERN